MRWVGLSVVAVVLVLAAALVWALREKDERSGGAAPSQAVDELERTQPALLEAPQALSAPAGEGGEAARTAVEPLVLAVFDPDGAPLAGGQVVVFQDAQVLGQAVSGESGEVRFTLPEGEGEVAVWAPWLPAHRQRVALKGRHELRLAGGAAVAGMVLVDGLPPGKPVELQLFSDPQLRSNELFPPSVMAVLGLKRASFAALRARTDEGGHFRFSGLPELWAGRLEWQGELFLTDGLYDPLNSPPKELALAEPAEDVVLRLAGPGLIKARFVTREGQPMGSASVVFDVPAQQRLASKRQPCAADGTYGRLVQLPFPDEIVLRVASPARDVYAAHFRNPPPTGALWDLGDVVVPPAPALRVEVRNLSGELVVGAEVTASARGRPDDPLTATMRTVAATDAAGVALLKVREDVESVSVAHPDYSPVVMPAPLDLDTPVRFTLCPAATLLVDFEVRSADAGADYRGVPNSFYFLHFTCERAEPGAGWAASRRPGSSAIGEGNAFSLMSAEPLKPISGSAPAGVPLHLSVIDNFGRAVQEATLAPLAPGEVKRHHVRVEWQPATLRLRALDPAGRPIANAGVMLDGVYRFWTDRAGEVEYRGLAPGPLALTLTHRLYGDLSLPVVLGAESELLEVRLTPR